MKDDAALDAYLAGNAVEGASLVPASDEPPIEGEPLERLLLAHAAAREAIRRQGHRFDPALLERLLDAAPLDAAWFARDAAQRDADLRALEATLNAAGVGRPRYRLAVEGEALVVERRHMGENTRQQLPRSLFEQGELRAVRVAAELLHGLVRDGAEVRRGARAQAVQRFTEAEAWLLEEAKKGRQIQRFKGLGEMNPEQLWETTVNPDTRRLLQVRIEDAVAADRIFSMLMGDVVEPRREFIEDNALKVANLDV
jgi:DNA gyrase subunit B